MSEHQESGLEKVIAAPAQLLEEGVETFNKVEQELINKKPFTVAKEYWNNLGPGLTTGASDDDPSGIATYSQTGAQYGTQLLWLSLFTFPLMAVVQEMCARIGMVSGKGLAANIRTHYSKTLLYIATFFLVAANVFNIGADLGAMAQGAKLLAPSLNFALLVIAFGVISLLLQIFTTYARYAKYLKYLALVLLSYVASSLFIHLNWGQVFHDTLIPSFEFSRNQIFLVCAILGTTISPYLFFWQTSQEVEEEILKGELTLAERQHSVHPKTIRRMRADVWTGMFVSNLVMFFIIATCAATLYTNNITDITSAADAALALKPFAGNFAFILFAVGIIGTGMLAIPVLAGSASYAVSESMGWKFGLYRKLKNAYSFYGVIILAMIVGIGLNFIGLDPIKALIYSAVGNGLVAPIILFFIVHLSADKSVMGKHANKPVITWIGWMVVGLMTAAGIAAIVSLFI
ncbi:MAG: natural resistance-associated macrophage protein [Candidatus Nomurabacteria bacterium]|nr:natural resistance-associated macrophage protein [Candidatus Nomurabacteria bacterium]